MKIVILGGGNIGSLLIGDLGNNPELEIFLYTENFLIWKETIDVFDKDDNLLFSGELKKASNDKNLIFKDANIIISTLPSHIFPKVLKEIEDYISPKSILVVIPGSGGVEYLTDNLKKKDCIIIGFQRVHGIARIKEKGKSVYSLGKKDQLYISSVKKINKDYYKNLIEHLFNIKTIFLDNYLNITLTPSNPILHTTRLYSLFHNYKNENFKKNVLFYEEWNDASSNILLACDKELELLCNMISNYGLDQSSVQPLYKYYEANNPQAFTKKIKSIKAFQSILSPMIFLNDRYIPDFESRYFKEDFLFGLVIIKSCALLFEIETKNIDIVLKWFESIANITLYVDGIFSPDDELNLVLPHLLFSSKNDFISYYKQ